VALVPRIWSAASPGVSDSRKKLSAETTNSRATPEADIFATVFRMGL
jgi:hypothetical protein